MEIPIVLKASLVLVGLWIISPIIKIFRSNNTGFPPQFPIIGVRKEVFSVARASLRQLTGGIKTLLEGYRQVTGFQQSTYLEASRKCTDLIRLVYSMASMASRTSSTTPVHNKNSSCRSSTSNGFQSSPSPSFLAMG